jgi:hypothetical protein
MKMKIRIKIKIKRTTRFKRILKVKKTKSPWHHGL